MTRTGRFGGESGAGLMELVVAMPLVVLLSAALAAAFAFGLRAYLFLLSDWALQEQVSYAMERMTTDLRYAEDAKIENGRLRILCRAVSGSPQWVAYERTQEARPRIRRDSQPLTGESTLGEIVMRSFEAERIDAKTVFLRLVGENLLTGQTYELETAVTWAETGA
ncbi:MAG: hypothetical protein J5477_06605 [Schwartzia sp.]|nr:hypothetical protein [Schwartzia sp. (in: firmicutes)]